MAAHMSEIQQFTTSTGRTIAYRHHAGNGTTLVFLPGYMSDMDGGKATTTFDWARENGIGCLLFDYSGCGLSEGDFADGTLSRWRDEALELIDAKTDGSVVLIGSSMGGWLMLMIAIKLGRHLAGMIGIASAPDFTEWGRSSEDKARLREGKTVYDENPYGPEPTPMHPGFFADGQANLMLGDTIPIDCPVRLIHGQRDADVPWEISLTLAEALRSDAVQVRLVKDGDHRMSRERDIDLLLATIAEISR